MSSGKWFHSYVSFVSVGKSQAVINWIALLVGMLLHIARKHWKKWSETVRLPLKGASVTIQSSALQSSHNLKPPTPMSSEHK